jgi:L-ascorbate metabolism protein UlaG (beta-lactamase superfamily)
MRIVRGVFAVLAVLLLLAGGWAAWRINTHPPLEAYRSLALPQVPAEAGKLHVTFLGVSSLLLDDGETAILTDGFFTRPPKLGVLFGRVEPDRTLIATALQRAGITRLAAVIAVHSHYDHAMDSPEVARQTGALLIGSTSTANIGRGWGLSEDRMRVAADRATYSFGRFTITMLLSRHFPHPLAMGEITDPLVPPAHALSYREGGSYSVLVEHDGRRLLIQGSAGFIEGALAGHQADVVFLGIGGMGKKDGAYKEAYWQEVVGAVRARRIVPIHWDDFTLPLDRPLQAMPYMLDAVPASLDFLLVRGREQGVEVRLPVLWQKADPFGGL